MATDSDVFISYASDTKPLAEELARVLLSQGFHAWVDFDLRPGQHWREQLDRALENAHWVLFLISPNSRAMPWQEAEWSTALAHAWTHSDKKVLPVLVGGTEAPPFLRNWVALTVDPVGEPALWTRRVLDALRSAHSESAKETTGRRERNERLTEMGRAAEELRKLEMDESPTTARL